MRRGLKKASAITPADWAEHALSKLVAAGCRRGGARTAVVTYLGAQTCAVSAREVEAALRGRGKPVGRASVYRALEDLAQLRLVTRLDVGDGLARYEPARPGGEHHHHLVCDSCGAVEPFEDPALERAIAKVAGRVAFAVEEHDVVLHGNCSGCA
jgi:Fur family transcriptional regulator, ferric uptake regulator